MKTLKKLIKVAAHLTTDAYFLGAELQLRMMERTGLYERIITAVHKELSIPASVSGELNDVAFALSRLTFKNMENTAHKWIDEGMPLHRALEVLIPVNDELMRDITRIVDEAAQKTVGSNMEH